MNIALVLSGGVGTRLESDIPKQYIRIGGRMVITFCLKTIFEHPSVDAVQIVAENEWQEPILSEVDFLETNRYKLFGFSNPGINRQMSIYHALQDIRSWAENDTAVLVHDAARPCLSRRQISDCLEALDGHDGVMPVLPVKDTVYKSLDGKSVSKLLDRSCLFAGQAPEVYRMNYYYRANECLIPDKILRVNGSTEPAVLAGLDVVMIRGDEHNFKITTTEDLERFRQIAQKKQDSYGLLGGNGYESLGTA